MGRHWRLTGEALAILLGQIGSVLGALLLVRVLTEGLSLKEYGELSLALTVSSLIGQLIMGGLIAGIGRYYSIALEKSELWSYMHASKILMVYATAVVILMGVLLYLVMAELNQGQWFNLYASALIYSIFVGYKGALSAIQNAARQRMAVAYHSIVDAWLNVGIIFLLIYFDILTNVTVVIAYIFSSVLVAISQLINLQKIIPKSDVIGPKKEGWQSQIWAYAAPFSAWGIFSWLQQNSDKWSLEYFAGTEEVAGFAVLYQLGYAPITMLSGVLISFLGPILYRRSGSAMDLKRNQNVHGLSWTTANLTLALTLTGFIIAISFHQEIFKLLVADQYRTNSHLLSWVVLAGGLFACGQVLSLKLMSEIRVSELRFVKIVTALMGVAANYLGAKFYGINGVVIGLCIFSIFYYFAMVLLAKKIPKR